jgi:hypothetical protein
MVSFDDEASGSRTFCPCGCDIEVERGAAAAYLRLELAVQAVATVPLNSDSDDLVLGQLERRRRILMAHLHEGADFPGDDDVLGVDSNALWLRTASVLGASSNAAWFYTKLAEANSGRSWGTVRIQDGFEHAFEVAERIAADGLRNAEQLQAAIDEVYLGLQRGNVAAAAEVWLQNGVNYLTRVAEGDVDKVSLGVSIMAARASLANAQASVLLGALYRSVGFIVPQSEILTDLQSWQYGSIADAISEPLSSAADVGLLLALVDAVDGAFQRLLLGSSALEDLNVAFATLGVVRAAAYLARTCDLDPAFIHLLEMQSVPLEMEVALSAVGVSRGGFARYGFESIITTASTLRSVWDRFVMDVAGPKAQFLLDLDDEWLAGGSALDPSQERLPGLELASGLNGERVLPSGGSPADGQLAPPAPDSEFVACAAVYQIFVSSVAVTDAFLRGREAGRVDDLDGLAGLLPAAVTPEIRGEFARLVAIVQTLRASPPLYAGVDLFPKWKMPAPSALKYSRLRLLADTLRRAHGLLETVVAVIAPHWRADFQALWSTDTIGPAPSLSQDSLDVLSSLAVYAARIAYRADRNGHGEIGHVAGIWQESQALLDLVESDRDFIPHQVFGATSRFRLALAEQRKPRLRPTAIRTTNLALAKAARDLVQVADGAAR